MTVCYDWMIGRWSYIESSHQAVLGWRLACWETLFHQHLQRSEQLFTDRQRTDQSNRPHSYHRRMYTVFCSVYCAVLLFCCFFHFPYVIVQAQYFSEILRRVTYFTMLQNFVTFTRIYSVVYVDCGRSLKVRTLHAKRRKWKHTCGRIPQWGPGSSFLVEGWSRSKSLVQFFTFSAISFTACRSSRSKKSTVKINSHTKKGRRQRQSTCFLFFNFLASRSV